MYFNPVSFTDQMQTSCRNPTGMIFLQYQISIANSSPTFDISSSTTENSFI
jgi:hypothetical protein